MLSLILLVYLGVKISAPGWYFWMCGVIGIAKVVKIIIDILKGE